MSGELIQVWDYLVDNGVATDDELRLVTSINGMHMDSLNSVIYVRTGYHDIEQLKEEG